MNKLILSCAAVAVAAMASVPAGAVVTIGGFTLDEGTFGAQTGVHSTGEQTAATVTGYVNKDNSSVTFGTTSGKIHINGQGEAVLDGDPILENLTVQFGKAWDKVTFNFEGEKGIFNLLVNGSALFSGTGNCADFCEIGKGVNQFVLTGSAITSLAFTFDPGIGSARQFRVDVPSAVPEPASWALMIGGLGLVGVQMRRRKAIVSFG